jgi:hypothetical protein
VGALAAAVRADLVGVVVHEKVTLLRRMVPFLGLCILAALIYDGAIFYSRWSRDRQAKQAEADRDAEAARKTIDAVGGGGLKIVSFYAAPATIGRGGHTELCYGVTGAKTLRMEPAVDAVWPALTRCVQVSPKKVTEYRLIAEDEAGHSVTGSVLVTVR